jgi:hypothetical protein
MSASIIQDRINGLYTVDDTRNEARYCANHLLPGEVAITIIRHLGRFNSFSRDQFAAQVRMWKKLNITLLHCNIHSIDLPKIKDPVLITVQNDEEGLCPLAMSFGVMVSGYSYITSRPIAEWTWRQLGSKK